MMTYYYIEPEVAGELGVNTILDSSTHPPRVEKLHYRFSGWLGDAILESFPCFIITQSAANALNENGVTGITLSDVEVSVSEEFDAMYPQKMLPQFRWIKIFGKPGKDDFGIADDLRLVVSDRALRILREFGVSQSLIEKWLPVPRPPVHKQKDE